MKSILQVALMLSLLTAACTRQTPPPTQAQSFTSNSLSPEATPVDEDDKGVTSLIEEEQRIVEIARKAAAEKGWGDMGNVEFYKPHKNEEGSWFVTLNWLPAVPGGHVSIEINAEGKVIGYREGE